MNNKAVVFDNSGTLIERYRAIQDIDNNKIHNDKIIFVSVFFTYVFVRLL